MTPDRVLGERRQEAARAASGAAVIGIGHVVTMLAMAALTIIVPRVLGSSDYGSWVLFRSVFSLLLTACMLGTPAIMSRHYVAAMAAGDRDGAGRLFKSVAVFRLLAALAAAAAGFLLLLALRNPALGAPAGVLLAWSIIAQSTGITFQLLLFAEREMRRIAVLNFLQSVLAPLGVTLAYLAGSFRWVPAGCAVGDTLFALSAYFVARPRLPWPAGWLERGKRGPLVAFGGGAAVANTARAVYGETASYLMGLAGVDPRYIGFLGLALRVKEVVNGLLRTTSTAMFPSIARILETEGLERSVIWQGLLCRLGALLALSASGVFLIVGRFLVPLLWGDAFAPAVDVVSLCLVMVVPLWIGFQHSDTTLLMHKPLLAVKTVGWLYGVFLLSFVLLHRWGGAVGTVVAMLAGSVFFVASSIVYVRRAWNVHLQVSRLIVPLVVVLAAVPAGRWVHSAGGAVVAVAAWLALFAAGALASRSLTWTELKDILRNLRPGSRTD